jgi:hypothetical protein
VAAISTCTVVEVTSFSAARNRLAEVLNGSTRSSTLKVKGYSSLIPITIHGSYLVRRISYDSINIIQSRGDVSTVPKIQITVPNRFFTKNHGSPLVFGIPQMTLSSAVTVSSQSLTPFGPLGISEIAVGRCVHYAPLGSSTPPVRLFFSKFSKLVSLKSRVRVIQVPSVV